MARHLSTTDKSIDIDDRLGGSTIRFLYRMPSSPERAAYQNKLVQRKGRKVRFRQGETRQEFGMKILTGYIERDKNGEFVFTRDHGGASVPMSSDRNSPHYYEGWKDEVAKGAMDLVETLAMVVFENSAEPLEESDDEKDDEVGGKDAGEEGDENP